MRVDKEPYTILSIHLETLKREIESMIHIADNCEGHDNPKAAIRDAFTHSVDIMTGPVHSAFNNIEE